MTGKFLPDGVFRCEICFGPQDMDRFGRVDGSALLWQLQEIAAAHYEARGYGDAFIRAHGCFWAVIRTELTFFALVPPGESLWLDTWSGKAGHGLYRRHYRLQTPGGGILLRGVSTWVLMDAVERVLTKDRSWLPDPDVIEQPDELAGQRRVAFPALSQQAERTVQRSETDINGHLNNTVYLRWAQDLLPDAYEKSRRLRGVWVEYKKELPLGQTAALHYTLEGDALYVIGSAEDKDSFLMRCEYDSI